MFLQSTDKIVGRYSIAKRDADSNVLEQYEFNNLIIPTALAQAAQRRLIEVIELGSGITPPTEQDSTLSAPIGGQWIVAYKDTTAGFDADSNQPTLSYNYYALIPEGIAISNIREFGMFDSNTGLFSRALLKAGEEQLTLSKGESEYIEIYYSVIFKLPLGAQPVKTMTLGDQTITVTSTAYANSTGIGRFDAPTLIDGIYLNDSEVPAVGHDFQPTVNSILPVSLAEHQLLGRQDVNYVSGLLTEATSIHEIVVKTQVGWYSYKFSPALELPLSSKWSLGFGVQWAQNTGAFTTPPQVFMLSVIDDIVLAPDIDIVSYDSGIPENTDVMSFVGMATETNTSATYQALANYNPNATSAYLGHKAESDVYVVQLHDYYGAAVFQIAPDIASWLKDSISSPDSTVTYDVTFNGEVTPAYTFDKVQVETLFQSDGENLFFTPILGYFNSVHHIKVIHGVNVFEVNVSKEGFLPNLFKSVFSVTGSHYDGNVGGTYLFDMWSYVPAEKVTYLSSSSGYLEPVMQVVANIPIDQDTYNSRWVKLQDLGFQIRLELGSLGTMNRSIPSMISTSGGVSKMQVIVVYGASSYSVYSPIDPRDIFTKINFGLNGMPTNSAYIAKPDTTVPVTAIAPNDSFDIVLKAPNATIGTVVTIATPLDITPYNLSPVLPLDVPLSSETIRIRFHRG